MSKNIYFLDLETTQINSYKKYGEVEMRLGVLSNKLQTDSQERQFKCNYFFKMEDLIQKIMKLEKDNSIIYTANLNFDGKFIMDYLYDNIDLVDDIREEDFVSSKYKMGLDKEEYKVGDSYLIDFSIGAKLTSLKVRFANGRKIEFRCFFKLYAGVGSVKDFGKIIGLPKLDEDVKVYDCSYEEFITKPKEWLEERKAYAKRDIEILYRFAQMDFHTNKESPMRMRKIPLTAASLSMKIIKNKDKKLFEWLWKDHLDIEQDSVWKQYRGGFTFRDEANKNKIIEDTYSIDINSSYPYQYTNYLAPCLKPIVLKNLPNVIREGRLYNLCITISKAEFKDKKHNFQPFLPKCNLKVQGRFIEEFNQKDQPIEMSIWLEELVILEKYYKLSYEINKVYEFKTTDYLIKHAKELVDKKFTTKDKMEKALIKILINSLYGKFGQKPELLSRKYNPHTKEWDPKISKTDGFKYYPPVASYISMKARLHLYSQIERLNKLGAKVFYGDTDSLKFGGISKDIIEANQHYLNIGNKLGQWELEGHYKKFKYLAPKVYMSINDKDEVKVVIKGYNGDNKYSMNEFTYGIKYDDKTEAKNVKGGVLIIDNKEYQLNDSPYLIKYNVEDKYSWVNSMIDMIYGEIYD